MISFVTEVPLGYQIHVRVQLLENRKRRVTFPQSENQLESACELLQDTAYEPQRRLGRGRTASVYLVRHRVIRKQFALKLLHEHLAGGGERVARLKREARVLGRLQSPHIVQVVDFGFASNGSPFLVTEFLKGTSLAEELQRRRQPPREEWLEWISQTLRGIHAAHSVGIVHRDLSPSNIFLVEEPQNRGSVKLLDFGLSRWEQPRSSEPSLGGPGFVCSDPDEPAPRSSSWSADHLATRTGTIMGSPAYCSPEALRGEPMDVRSDLFSVGLILLQCATGRHPMDYSTNQLPVLSSQPMEGRTDAAGLRTIDEILQKALALHPEDRFRSAEAFLDALQRLRGSAA